MCTSGVIIAALCSVRRVGQVSGAPLNFDNRLSLPAEIP